MLSSLGALSAESHLVIAKDLANRLGKSTKALSSARRQLIQRQAMQAVRRGHADFAIPFMREFLIDNEDEIWDRL